MGQLPYWSDYYIQYFPQHERPSFTRTIVWVYHYTYSHFQRYEMVVFTKRGGDHQQPGNLLDCYKNTTWCHGRSNNETPPRYHNIICRSVSRISNNYRHYSPHVIAVRAFSLVCGHHEMSFGALLLQPFHCGRCIGLAITCRNKINYCIMKKDRFDSRMLSSSSEDAAASSYLRIRGMVCDERKNEECLLMTGII